MSDGTLKAHDAAYQNEWALADKLRAQATAAEFSHAPYAPTQVHRKLRPAEPSKEQAGAHFDMYDADGRRYLVSVVAQEL